MSGVFISYRREDSSYIAGRLHDRLAADLGPDHIFRDVDAMKPGVDFARRIDEAVGSCDVLLAVIGRDWLSAQGSDGGRRIDGPRDWVRLEIGAALQREILVVPVLVENARMPSEDELPDDLRPLARRNAMELTDRRWNDDVGDLLEILREAMAPHPAPAPAAAPAVHPAGPARFLSPRERLAGLSSTAKRSVGALVALLLVAFVAAWFLGTDDDEGAGTGSSTALTSPAGLALDGAGNLYVADPGKDDVLQVDIGTGAVTGLRQARLEPGSDGQLYVTPWAVAWAAGTLYVAGKEDGGILRFGPDRVVTRVVARSAGRDLPGASALAVDREGRLVAATDREVFRVEADGRLTLLVGGPTKGFGGDGGPATAAKLSSPSALAYGPDGSLYVADSGNRRVRRVAPDGTITTVAGTGSEIPDGDGGLAVEAGLGTELLGLAVDRAGNVYLAAENQVRRIGADGRIGLFAGHPEFESGYSGDGGPARDAVLDGVSALAVDDDGALYLLDAGNGRVRKVDPAGIITTVA